MGRWCRSRCSTDFIRDRLRGARIGESAGFLVPILLFATSACTDTSDLAGQPRDSGPPEVQDIVLDTVFFEDFESGSFAAWGDGYTPLQHRILENRTDAPSGNSYLEMTYLPGEDGRWLSTFFLPGYDSVYVSYFVKLQEGWQGATKLSILYGSRVDDQWSGMGRAGSCPNGTDFFLAGITTLDGSPGRTHFYTYWPDMNREPDGVTCWGRLGDTEYVELRPGVWHWVEHWVKLNEPGFLDSVQRFWIDGSLYGDWEGIRLRDTDDLRLNAFQISANAANGSPRLQSLYIDDVVIVANGLPPNRR